jgi:hypothetical protein
LERFHRDDETKNNDEACVAKSTHICGNTPLIRRAHGLRNEINSRKEERKRSPAMLYRNKAGKSADDQCLLIQKRERRGQYQGENRIDGDIYAVASGSKPKA